MSHHLDYPKDETLDITDAYYFAGPGDVFGPRTVFGINTSPLNGRPWNPAGLYELRIDTNGDYVEDITYRATFPDYPAAGPPTDFFANTSVRSFVLEVPVEITGFGRLHFWGTTAYYDTGHSTWVQLQRAGLPNMTTFFDFANGSAKVADYNSTSPTIDLVGRPAHSATDSASGIWGQVRDDIAAVVEAGDTYSGI